MRLVILKSEAEVKMENARPRTITDVKYLELNQFSAG